MWCFLVCRELWQEQEETSSGARLIWGDSTAGCKGRGGEEIREEGDKVKKNAHKAQMQIH